MNAAKGSGVHATVKAGSTLAGFLGRWNFREPEARSALSMKNLCETSVSKVTLLQMLLSVDACTPTAHLVQSDNNELSLLASLQSKSQNNCLIFSEPSNFPQRDKMLMKQGL